MSKLKAEALMVHYRVDLEGFVADIDDLDKADDILEELGPLERLSDLDEISDVNWSGHFGNCVYFAAESDEARDRFLRELEEILGEIERMKEKGALK